MEKIDYEALAAELAGRLPKHPNFPSLDVRVWAEDEGINVAPAVREWYGNRVHYVREVVTFADYYELDVTTWNFGTGSGLRLS